jgi:hypothetical protein
MQKRASGGASAPQDGQERASAVPQEKQNLAPSGTSVEQDGHVRELMPSVWPGRYPRFQSNRPGIWRNPSRS